MDTNLEPLDRLRAPDLTEEVGRRLTVPPRPIAVPPRGARRATAAGVAFAVFLAAAAFAWGMFHGPAPEVPATDPWAWAPEGWTELPAPPEYRDGAAVVWMGSTLFYWGGLSRGDKPTLLNDGWTFDPTTQTWSPLPPAPASLARGDGVWTGSEVIVWGEVDPLQETDVPKSDFEVVLAFDPTRGTWRTLPPAPHLPEWGGTWAWTGRELVVFGGGRPDASTAVSGVALDPIAGSWRVLADAPLPMSLANAAWDGDEVVIVGAAMQPGNHSTTRTAVALAYRPSADAWRVLPTPPLSPQSSDIAAVGARIIAWDYGGDSAEYLASEDRWRNAGRMPLDHGECYVSGVAAGDTLFAWNCGYPDAWYPGSGWRDVVGGPAPDVPVTRVVGSVGWAANAGDVAVVGQIDNVVRDGDVYLGDEDSPGHLWVWRPPSSPPPPRPVTETDVEIAVSGFLTAWGPGMEPYLATAATAEVIERCRAGTDGVPSLEGWGYRSWNTRQPVEVSPGVYEMPMELRRDGEVDVELVFRAVQGMAADGSTGPLVIVDVHPA